jgi:hypothetical protein
MSHGAAPAASSTYKTRASMNKRKRVALAKHREKKRRTKARTRAAR